MISTNNSIGTIINKPLVSIKCMAYNHAPYIKECIEGILMQKTSFKFELVIGEDYSTDGTREIVLDYKNKYPDVIKLVISDYNVGGWKNSERILNACTGMYIAFCEGDDYWTDPNKLQKQVDFLEANPEYGLVHTGYLSYHEEKKKFLRSRKRKIPTGDIFEIMLEGFNSISTMTALVKRDLLFKAAQLRTKPSAEFDWKMGDLPLWLEISRISKVGYVKDKTAVYRILSESASHSKSNETQIKFLLSSLSIREWFCQKYDKGHLYKNIVENKIFHMYYKSIIGGFEELDYYRNKVRTTKIRYSALWKTFFKILSTRSIFENIFRTVYIKLFRS